MSERRRAIERIIALQGRAKAIAEARVARAATEQAETAAARAGLQAFIEGADLHGALAVLAVRQTRDLAMREIAAQRRHDALATARREVETRLKLAERVGEAVARDERAAAERAALTRLIEEAVARQTGDEEE